MVVKVLIKRKIKEGKTREVFSLLNKFRSDAMSQTGYISGETLINHDNPQEILVIAMWQGIENWLKWKDNPNRAANECIFRVIPAADSGRSRPPVPIDSGRLFRTKPATHSGAFRPPQNP